MTGTMLQGGLVAGDMLEIPAVGISRKVKSMQMFRVGVDKIVSGDRAGVCVTQFDPQLLERGLVCTPGLVPSVYAAIIDMSKIAYFKGEIRTKAKFHITVGHETVMAKITVFGYIGEDDLTDEFDFSKEYKYQDGYIDKPSDGELLPRAQFALLEFERCVPVVPASLVIGSRLDTDIHTNTCRLAFRGTTRHFMKDKNYPETCLPNLKVFKHKAKEGVVERASNEYEVIVKNLVKKETNIDLFTGLNVVLSSGERGTIEGSFGQSGKIKVRVPEGLRPESMALLGGKKKKTEASVSLETTKVTVEFKRYIFDPRKAIIQT
jgi:selenocysteine-specific elongation factor